MSGSWSDLDYFFGRANHMRFVCASKELVSTSFFYYSQGSYYFKMNTTQSRL